MIYSDIELSRKLERTEGSANADLVEARARLQPESGAAWSEIAGTFAMFDGVESPLTQTFGLGLFEPATDQGLARLESFFKDRGAPVFHEVSPLNDQSILALLSGRGYDPIELTSVMFQPLHGDGAVFTAGDGPVTAARIVEGEEDLWASIVADGWANEQPELYEFLRSLGTINARASGSHPFIARKEGQPVAAGGLLIYGDVCILAGAATIPTARRQGAQNALLSARLRYAADRGCNFAMMCTAPGSQSQKNAQRNGFQIAYTRIKWQLNK